MATCLQLFLTIPVSTCGTSLKGAEKARSFQKRGGPGGFTIQGAATLPGQGGVLDRPTLDKPTPGRESEFDIKYVTFITPNLTMRPVLPRIFCGLNYNPSVHK
jgi:hypothetical protein